MTIVSINGSDNVGKSTQIRWLRADRPDIPDLGGIHRYGKWPLLQPEESAKWWFVDSQSDELIRTVASAFQERNHAIQNSPELVVLDRGCRQFEAVLTASVMVKDGVDRDTAARLVKDIAGDIFKRNDIESLRIILTYRSVETLLAKEPQVSDTYRRYQDLLFRELHKQIEDQEYHIVLDCDGQSVLQVQNRLRQCLHQRNIHVPLLLDTAEHIYAFGGLSESGKSTSADYLRRKFGVSRLKLSYLVELAALRGGIEDIYSIPEADLAELVTLELCYFCRRQYYLATFSIESLHRMEMTAHLKRIIGSKLIIAFCEAGYETRLSRAQDDRSNVIEKDAIKTSRGAQDIRSLADVVIHNSGTRMYLYRQLDRMINRARVTMAPTIVPLTDLLLPAPFEKVASTLLSRLQITLRDRLILFAVIGSRGRREGVSHSSDLDIFVVVESDATDVIREVVLEIPVGVKLGLTVAVHDELSALAVDSKIFHALRLMSHGQVGVQFAKVGTSIPQVSATADWADSMNYFPSVLQRLRREVLKSEPRTREVIKACLLLAKIILRTEGEEIEDKQAVFERLIHYYPSTRREDLSALTLSSSQLLKGISPAEIAELGVRFLGWFDNLALGMPTD